MTLPNSIPSQHKSSIWSIFLPFLALLVALGAPTTVVKAQSPGVQGRILLKNQNKGLEFASVAVLKTADSALVSGSLTRSGGYFGIEKVPVGRYLLEVRFLGCIPLYRNFQVIPSVPITELGNLYLEYFSID